MRSVLFASCCVALLTVTGCQDEPNPDEVPRTVPPASEPTTLERPAVRGTGPVYEARSPEAAAAA